jgi:hypothetical protein
LGERLVVAVQRHTRQRHQMPPVHREQDALARRGSLCSTPFSPRSRASSPQWESWRVRRPRPRFLSRGSSARGRQSLLQLGSLTGDGTVLAMFSGTICHNLFALRCPHSPRTSGSGSRRVGCCSSTRSRRPPLKACLLRHRRRHGTCIRTNGDVVQKLFDSFIADPCRLPLKRVSSARSNRTRMCGHWRSACGVI